MRGTSVFARPSRAKVDDGIPSTALNTKLSSPRLKIVQKMRPLLGWCEEEVSFSTTTSFFPNFSIFVDLVPQVKNT